MSLAKSFLWLTIAELAFNLSGYVVQSGAGRILTTEDYGRYGLVITLSIMVVALLGNGVPIAMGKYISEYSGTKPEMVALIKRKGLLLQLGVIGVLTAAFYFATPLLAHALGDPTLIPLFRISVFILPMFAIDSFYFYYLTGIKQFNFQSFLKILRSVLRIVLIITLIYFLKLKGAVIGYILVPFLVFLTAWAADKFWISKKFPKTPPGVEFDWKKLLKYAWPITLFMIFYELLISLDLYFVKGILHDDHLTGIYNSALMIARIPYYLFYALTIILLPSVSDLVARSDLKKARELVSSSLRFMIMILFPMVVLMAVYARPSISFIFGEKYTDGTLSLQILAFGVGFLTVFYILSFALNGAGKVKSPMWIAFFGMLTNAVLNYFFIKKFGIVGSAIATSITSLLVMFVSVYDSNRYFRGVVDLKSIGKISAAGGVLYLFSFLFPPQNYIFILWSFLLLGIYVLALYLFKELKPSDWQVVKEIIRKKKGHPGEDELTVTPEPE